MQVDDGLVGDPGQRRDAVGHDVGVRPVAPGLRVLPAGHPVRRVAGELLLPELGPAGHAVRPAMHVEGPVTQVGQQDGRHGRVVADQVPLGESRGREEHLVQVGELHGVPADLPAATIAQGRQRRQLRAGHRLSRSALVPIRAHQLQGHAQPWVRSGESPQPRRTAPSATYLSGVACSRDLRCALRGLTHDSLRVTPDLPALVDRLSQEAVRRPLRELRPDDVSRLAPAGIRHGRRPGRGWSPARDARRGAAAGASACRPSSPLPTLPAKRQPSASRVATSSAPSSRWLPEPGS